jgi:hypothetical protein
MRLFSISKTSRYRRYFSFNGGIYLKRKRMAVSGYISLTRAYLRDRIGKEGNPYPSNMQI